MDKYEQSYSSREMHAARYCKPRSLKNKDRHDWPLLTGLIEGSHQVKTYYTSMNLDGGRSCLFCGILSTLTS